MAFSMAEAVLKKLAPLAAEQLGYLWGLRSEISKLERTVSSIKAVLLDAEEQSSHNHQVQHWLGQLKEVLYDVDDLLDDLATEAVRKQQMDGNCVANEVHLFFSGSNEIVYGLEMARAIKEVQSKLDEIAMVKERFKFEMRSMEQAVAVGDWRRTDSSIPDAVVGREEDKWKLIDMVQDSCYKEKVAVIPVVGIGGLGKTTLAQLLYNDAHVEHVELWGVKNELLDHLVDSLPPPSSPLLSRFTSLKLHEIEGLLVLPQGLLPHLTCLESLSIDRCKDFTTLSPAVIQHLTSLQRLELSSCPCLASWKGGYDHGGDEKKNKMTMMPMCALPCLHSLRFFNLPKLLHLPEWLRHSSNLQKLQMNDCVALKGLPEWLTKLAAVKSLEVNSCGDLSTRCRGQTALDWPYIAQIPNIEVDDRVIQKDGCYLGLDQGQGEGNSEDEDDDEEEEEEEESAQDKLANGFARLTCGLFRRCFLC